MEATAQQPIIVQAGGGGMSTVKVVGGLILLAGVAYFGKQWYDQRQKNSGEEDLDTPAGKIALQLKTVFDATIVDNAEYKRVALQITPELRDDVYKIYRKIALRNLSDDIARIKAGVQTLIVKQEIINTTVDTIINITPDDQIKFLVGKGSVVRFPPGEKNGIPLYLNPINVAYGKPVFFMLKPSALQFLVSEVREVPFEGVKEVNDWTKFFRPVVKTRKVFAAVAILLPLKDAKGNKKVIKLWADARLFRKGKGSNYLKGLDSAKPNTTSISLVA